MKYDEENKKDNPEEILDCTKEIEEFIKEVIED